MPIWLRKFTFAKIDQYYEKQNESTSGNANSTKLVDSKGNVNKDQFRKLTNTTVPPPVSRK